MTIDDLCNELRALANSLRRDGKEGSAEYLEKIQDALINPDAEERFRYELEKLRGSMTMSQYADFTYEQEKLLGEIVDKALRIKSP